jgi:hypothetical protein
MRAAATSGVAPSEDGGTGRHPDRDRDQAAVAVEYETKMQTKGPAIPRPNKKAAIFRVSAAAAGSQAGIAARRERKGPRADKVPAPAPVPASRAVIQRRGRRNLGSSSPRS